MSTLKLYEILPNLYQSARLVVIPTPMQRIQFLTEHQIYGVVNLWHTADEDIAAFLPFYAHYSIPDGQLAESTIAQLWAYAYTVRKFIMNDQRIIVHCYGGRNRSGLLNALVVMLVQGCSGSDAAQWVQRYRPNSLFNQHYLDYLSSLEAILHV